MVTADEVLKAQKEVKMDKSFSKPHPYTYVQAFLGKDYSSADCLNTQLPMEEAEEILIIGDSLADLLAAREMGARFAAVLTGLSGQDARGDFEKHRADYILDNVLELKGLLKTLEKSD
ncbi:HAD hydrolase-like protein [Neobacillus sp. PS3-34]|uniref:HAD family hydrolase n=1 Tax=Neobacillus sp. PS3-34 TaxID=3070678 RepID=UPI0027DF5472|nr:HAD hydrolase-like protein [Neobacillus sp. PS3-34]WML48275.1 HAD hydrolase-like protein [Neobacillus sp. PS3-34]